MKDLPKRKEIHLKDYDYLQNGYYFITICTNNRKHLFGHIKNETMISAPNKPDKMIKKWLFKLEEKFYGVIIHEYIIMPNHIHFILEQAGDHMGSPLQRIIGWFKTMTTNEYINGVNDGKYIPFEKKLWQRNYYEHIIREERDYLAIAEYILNNVLKWTYDKEL